MSESLRAGAQRNYASAGVDIYIWQPDANRSWVTAVAQPIVMQTTEDAGMDMRPCVTLPMAAAQMLIDELWNAGLRPKYAQATDATTAAQRAHIDDLRTVVTRMLDLAARP